MHVTESEGRDLQRSVAGHVVHKQRPSILPSPDLVRSQRQDGGTADRRFAVF